jgi:hypothetical protein
VSFLKIRYFGPVWNISNHSKFNSKAAISQAVCSLTSFFSAALGPFVLTGNTFQKWTIYTTGFFLIQSLQRTLYLENHLLESHQKKSHKYWHASYWIPSLIFVLPVVNLIFLNYKFSLTDFILIIGFSFALLQDRYRYLYLSNDPRKSLFGDLVWFFSSFLIMLISVVFKDLNLSFSFLLQLCVGPFLGFLFLIIGSKKIELHKIGIDSLNDLDKKYLQYVRTQFLFGLIVTFLFSAYVVKYLSVNELKTYRIIQTVISPYQSISVIISTSILATSYILNSFNNLFSILRFSCRLLIIQIPFSVIILVLNAKLSHQITINHIALPDTMFLAISLLGPMFMLSSTPLSAFMRKNRMGEEILISGIAGSISLLLLTGSLPVSSSILVILVSASLAPIFTVTISFILTAIKIKKGTLHGK